MYFQLGKTIIMVAHKTYQVTLKNILKNTITSAVAVFFEYLMWENDIFLSRIKLASF